MQIFPPIDTNYVFFLFFNLGLRTLLHGVADNLVCAYGQARGGGGGALITFFVIELMC